MRINKIFLLTLGTLLISACANSSFVKSAKTDNGVKVVAYKSDLTTDLLGFFETYSNLTPEIQKKVFTDTAQVLATNKNDLVNRIKMAGMLSLPTSRLRDTVKAQSQLQDILQENILSKTDNALVGLLYEYTVDSNKDVSKQSQKAHDDAKRIELLQQKADILQKKNDALEQKLNDLKNIEKTMNERNTKPTDKP